MSIILSISQSLLIIAMIFGAVVADGGNYATAKLSIASPPTDIYYPVCTSDGDGGCTVTGLPAGQKFPGVIFLQGASVEASAYSTIASNIAADGYIVAVPNAPITVFPPTFIPMQLTSPAIAVAAKTTLQTLSATSTSPLYGLLQDGAWSVLGHSFGGVIAMITGANDAAVHCAPTGDLVFLCFGYTGFGSPIKAVVTYGSSLVSRGLAGPGVTYYALNTTGVPVVLVHGLNDGRDLLVDDEFTYDSLINTPKALITLAYANHYGITDAQIIAGSTPDPSPQTKSQGWSTSQIGNIFTTALDAHVKNDSNSLNKIYVKMDLGPKFINVTGADL